MSRIDDLMVKMCPNGVEFKELGEIFDMKAGKFISAADISPTQDRDHLYPCYGGNGIRGFVRTYSHDGKCLLIGRQGALCGNVKRASGKFFATEHAVVCKGKGEVDLDWAFHLLTAMSLNQFATKSAQPGLAVGTIERVRTPLPPLEVQREIVKVLDTFIKLEEELEAELESELDKRGRQYKYYRDALLAFEGQNSVKWMPLGEVGTFIRGRRFTKADYVDNGIGVIHYGEIYTHYGTFADTVISHVSSDLASQLRFARPGDVIVTDVGETVEDVGKPVAWLGTEEVAIHDHCYAFRHTLNPKFVSYCMQTARFGAEKSKFVARTKVNTLLMNGFAKICIPVPPVEEQERIVAILDKFDALVKELSTCLPAELVARRRQYEYYRDRLLTFREAA